MAKGIIAGRISNTIGEKDSTLILRGTSIKIQWGNKYIDLIKKGKINAEYKEILKVSDNIDEETEDGIYLVNDQIWVSIGGTKIQLAGESSTAYVSFLVEQKETTAEQKERALTNIGFYYDTFEQAQNAGLTKGIIYVQGDNKLYVVKEGILTEFITNSSVVKDEESSEEEKIIEKLYISENAIMLNDEEYIICDNNTVTINKQLFLEDGLYSQGATNEYGYKLYMQNGQSYLEVDNIIQRNISPDDISIYPIKYYQEENIIITASKFVSEEETAEGETVEQEEEEEEYLPITNLEITLLYSNKYKIGDILSTSMLIDNIIEKEEEQEDGSIEIVEVTEKILVPIDFTIISINDNKYQVTTQVNKIDQNNIGNLINKSIFYKQGQLPVARLQDHNYDLFDANIEQNIENVVTRIGTISELGEKVTKYTDKNLGIYSNNAVLNDPILINSNQYNVLFKNINNSYPRYEEGWYIPQESKDQTIVTSLWVKNTLEGTLKNLETEITNLKSQLTETLNSINAEIENLKSSVNTINSTIENIKTSVNTNTKDIKDLQEQINNN